VRHWLSLRLTLPYVNPWVILGTDNLPYSLVSVEQSGQFRAPGTVVPYRIEYIYQ